MNYTIIISIIAVLIIICAFYFFSRPKPGTQRRDGPRDLTATTNNKEDASLAALADMAAKSPATLAAAPLSSIGGNSSPLPFVKPAIWAKTITLQIPPYSKYHTLDMVDAIYARNSNSEVIANAKERIAMFRMMDKAFITLPEPTSILDNVRTVTITGHSNLEAKVGLQMAIIDQNDKLIKLIVMSGLSEQHTYTL